jgi:2,3-bisphosphoglycerate-independent phosphoglycerate mutase
MVVTMDRYEADWAMVERGWARTCTARARVPSQRARGGRDLRAETRRHRPEPARVRDRRRRQAGRDHRDGDAVVFFNFRGDRAIEISRAFEEDDFDQVRPRRAPDVLYAGMMQYDGDLHIPRASSSTPPAIDRTMGEYLARNGVTPARVSETQKYGHVTYFWNGNRSGKFDDALETYVEIPSRPRALRAAAVDEGRRDHRRADRRARTGGTASLRVNYANGDMVGHTGDLDAAIIAVEAVDLQLARLLPPSRSSAAALIVTADHGNADEMYERDARA